MENDVNHFLAVFIDLLSLKFLQLSYTIGWCNSWTLCKSDLMPVHFAAYCVVAKESAGKQISIAFLERVRADFKKRYGGGKADTAVAKSLNKEFGYVV